MHPDYSKLPTDLPADCYVWVGRGPGAGHWRVHPQRRDAYLDRMQPAPPAAPEPAPAAPKGDDLPWGKILAGTAVAVLVVPALGGALAALALGWSWPSVGLAALACPTLAVALVARLFVA